MTSYWWFIILWLHQPLPSPSNYLFIYLHIQRHPQQKRWLLMSRWLWYDRKYYGREMGRIEMVGTWKLRETTASAAAANWRDAHLQMFKGTGKGVNRGPKTKHIMTKIMLLNMNVKSLIGVMSFRYSFRFHIGSLMRSARMFVCLPSTGECCKTWNIWTTVKNGAKHKFKKQHFFN